MWQRIQTLYLVLVATLMGIFAFSEIFIITTPAGEALILDAWTLRSVATGENIGGAWGIGVLSIIAMFIAIVDIFLYKRRVLQGRIAIFNAILLVGLVGLIVYSGYSYSAGVQLGFKFAVALPLVAIILQIMATRGILADEALVRISERLR